MTPQVVDRHALTAILAEHDAADQEAIAVADAVVAEARAIVAAGRPIPNITALYNRRLAEAGQQAHG